MGWGPWALGGIDKHRIEGEHVNLFREPYISHLAQQITQVLLEEGTVSRPSVIEPN